MSKTQSRQQTINQQQTTCLLACLLACLQTKFRFVQIEPTALMNRSGVETTTRIMGVTPQFSLKRSLRRSAESQTAKKVG
jgi:hypothetical protein